MPSYQYLSPSCLTAAAQTGSQSSLSFSPFYLSPACSLNPHNLVDIWSLFDLKSKCRLISYRDNDPLSAAMLLLPRDHLPRQLFLAPPTSLPKLQHRLKLIKSHKSDVQPTWAGIAIREWRIPAPQTLRPPTFDHKLRKMACKLRSKFSGSQKSRLRNLATATQSSWQLTSRT